MINTNKGTISKGYLLFIETSENDGDNPNTYYLSGLCQDDVRFIVGFCRHLSCAFGENKNNLLYLGNTEVSDKEGKNLARVAKELYLQYKSPLMAKRYRIEEYLDDESEFHSFVNEDLVSDLIGVWFEWSRYRVFEGFKVFYVPEDNIEVTSEFA
jgi:hypothetical protein